MSKNVTKLMNHCFIDEIYPNRTTKAVALAKKSGLGKNTVLRALDPNDTTSLSIDNLEALATALRVFPYQLLIPYFDIENPQTTTRITSMGEIQQLNRRIEDTEGDADKVVLKLAKAINNLQSNQKKTLSEAIE